MQIPPLNQAKVNGEVFSLRQVLGIGVDHEENIFIGLNKDLIKINSEKRLFKALTF